MMELSGENEEMEAQSKEDAIDNTGDDPDETQLSLRGTC